ncbi:MAG TPA: hypothetical protein VN643_04565 [Pyrinomonadaceae bacterium]|nr:hypothetical protein [Pyrinomonadaceae bacterium]
MTKHRRTVFTSAAPKWLNAVILGAAALMVLNCFGSEASAETLKKRYTFDYDRTTRRASSIAAATKARKKLLLDFLSAKFAPEIITNLAEDIDVALDPPDQFFSSFQVVSEKVSEDELKVTLTVEGEFDFPEMVTALVQNKVLSFGKQPPKVMVLPSSRFDDPKAAKTLRALIYDKIKQAGLRPVAFESAGESVSFRIKGSVTPTAIERQALIRTAIQYGADYLIYIDAEVESRPFQQGGYVADTNFIHTILRPNGALILGESITSERGSGSTAMLAFDRALDSVAPVIAKMAIGQLYQSIYSDSDVIYNTPKLLQEKAVVINFGNAALVEAVVARLKSSGASARLGTGMSDVVARISIETTMDDFELYEWFNQQKFTVGGKVFRTPVVAYAENRIEVEAVADQVAPRRPPIGKAPPRIKRPTTTQPLDSLAKVVLQLRPAKFN